MELTLWTYEGPPHVGAMRIATAMSGLHYVLHAPQGDTYADLLFTMIERRGTRPPVTYTTFEARDLGGDTAELFKTAVRDAYERFAPQAMLVGASCTAELMQDDPGGLARALRLPIPVIPLELPAYQKKENWGAAETFYRLVRALAGPLHGRESPARDPAATFWGRLRSASAIATTCARSPASSSGSAWTIGVTAPLGATPEDITRLGEADFNVVLYPEIALPAAQWLEKTHGQPFTQTIPIGVGATREFIEEVAALAGVDAAAALDDETLTLCPGIRARSTSTYLTGKRVFIFGDATHAIAAARDRANRTRLQGRRPRNLFEGIRPRGARSAAEACGAEALITDDYLEVEAKVAELQPELVLGTQMERHIAKRLGIPCAVISAPVHVQDFPARYSPQMGFEGANVLFDSWVHPLMMGLEEHLLTMFREDSEFHDGAAPSHLGGAVVEPVRAPPPSAPQRRCGPNHHRPASDDLERRRRKGAEENSVLRARHARAETPRDSRASVDWQR